MSSRQRGIELVKVEIERSDGSIKAWSVGVTDKSGARRSLEDVKEEIASFARLAGPFTLVCKSPSPLLGCGITPSCWDAVEDGAVLAVELDEVDAGQEGEKGSAERRGAVREGEGEEEEARGRRCVEWAEQVSTSAPDCIPTPSSSSNRDHPSPSLHSTADSFASAPYSPVLPLSPPHSLPGSRRSSWAVDTQGTSFPQLDASAAALLHVASPPTRSRSSTPARSPRSATKESPQSTPAPPQAVSTRLLTAHANHVYNSPLAPLYGADGWMGSGESSPATDASGRFTAGVGGSPSQLEPRATFAHGRTGSLDAPSQGADAVQLAARRAKSSVNLSYTRTTTSPSSSRPPSPALPPLLPAIASLTITQRPSSPRYPSASSSKSSLLPSSLGASRSTSRSRSHANVRFALTSSDQRPPTPARTPSSASPPVTPGPRVPPAQAPWIPLREQRSTSALRRP
ncbi:hypothetical protein JCM10450v2_002865 [Rhodotorula kratochvilovae]